MRCLERNKVKLYYATYTGESEIIDNYGNATGTFQVTYTNPVLMYANVSAARGTADVDLFGIGLDYTKAIVTDDMACPISETSIIWIDTMPTLDAEGKTTTPNDYIVKRVAKSLNNIAYAVSKVDVTYVAPPTPVGG